MTTAIARKLETLRIKGAIKNVDVANLLGLREETVSRWNQGKAYPQPDAEKALLALEYIIDELSDIYQPNEARQWVFSPQKQLAGKRPADLISTGGIDEVLNYVRQIKETVYF